MQNRGCRDAGREGCPCSLANYNKCIVCGRLSGGTCEDCNWQGSCIFTLYEQNKRQPVKARSGQLFDVEDVRSYSDSFKVYRIKAPKGFCQKASTAGAYVFARSSDGDIWSDMPISVLKAEPEKGLIHLGICACGPKSRAVLNEEKQLYIRGVYYNALSGMRTMTEKPEKNVVYGKGVAMAPLRNLLDGAAYLSFHENLKIYADIDKVGFDFFADYFGDVAVERVKVCDFASEGMEIQDTVQNANIFALTSPYYADKIEEAYERKVVRPTMGNMCCGEGMCGACTFDDENGNTIHRCKAD